MGAGNAEEALNSAPLMAQETSYGCDAPTTPIKPKQPQVKSPDSKSRPGFFRSLSVRGLGSDDSTILETPVSSKSPRSALSPGFVSKFLPPLRSLSDESTGELSGNDSSGCLRVGSLEDSPTKSPSRRIGMLRRRNSTKFSKRPTKHVHFAEGETDTNSDNSSSPPLVTVVETLAPLSLEEVKRSFWSPDEISKMSARNQRFSEDVAWKQDRHIRTCIDFLYRSSHEQNTKSKSSKKELTVESALSYVYSCKIALGDANSENGGEDILRGLERQISSRISDHQMECIQAVLSYQARIRQESSPSTKESPEDRLAKISAKSSLRDRKFARLLAKADKSVAENLQKAA